MAFPGNSSDGHYVRFNLLVGALLFPSVISNTRYKGQVSVPPRSLLQTDVLDGYPVKGVVAIVRGRSADSHHFSIDDEFVDAPLG